MAFLIKRSLWVAVLLVGPAAVFAQPYTISGFVQDVENSEKLIGATLYEPSLQLGTVSNRYGFFSLTLPTDSVVIRVAFVGYETRVLSFNLDSDIEITVDLTPTTYGLEEVEVIGERVEDITESTQMSTVSVPIAQIKALPALLGEVDVLKALQLLPGVQSGTEGASGLYVRGGGPDQNLILLDGAPVYNASHLFGFFSVFNADALQNITLVKGGFPARYGGRLSSVLDIVMKEGNMKEFQADGSVGLISSRLTLQGPLMKDKMSFIVSARRTYADIVARPFIRAQNTDEETSNAGYFFYDLNAKVNYAVSPKDRLYLSLYLGRDRFYDEFGEERGQIRDTYEDGLKWGNVTSTLRWNHVLSNKLFANTTLTYSRYQFDIESEAEFVSQEQGVMFRDYFYQTYLSNIEDWSAKLDLDYLPTPNHYIRFGGNVTAHTFRPGVTQFRTEETGTAALDTTITPIRARFNAREYYLYAEDDIRLNSRLKTNIGVHVSGLAVDGEHYTSVQPRIALRYLLTADWAFKASYSAMQQYLHLLTNTGINLPTDLWVPATGRVEPMRAYQVAAGIASSFQDGMYTFSVEGYYKGMQNLIEYKPGANFLNLTADWQDKIERGEGWSYGGEVLFQKQKGKTTGWIGYTLSWTERKFENLNNGKAFPYRYDRRHDLSVVVSHSISETWDISGTWVYGTGNALTIPLARFLTVVPTNDPTSITFDDLRAYGDRNGYRMAAYHRLDLAVNWHKKKRSRIFRKPFERTWTLSVYNAYSRRNPFFIYQTRNEAGAPVFKQVSLFPILPSLSYSFHF